MANVLKKFINNWIEYNLPNPKVFVITEDDVTVTTTDEYWVAPYNTSYYYTNIDISASAGIEWIEWAIYTFVVNTEMVVASAYRNVRVKIWNWNYIPVMWSSAIIAWSSYFTKANTRQYQYTTKYESWWALHLFTDSNTTYSAMTEAKAKAWTETTARSITAAVLKTAILYHAATLHDSTKQDALTAWNNIDITSNTISSDSTQAITQSDYDNLPSTKTSNHKTYMIYYEETI